MRDAMRWQRLSRWILNELDECKIVIDVTNCIVKIVTPMEACAFLKQNDIVNYRDGSLYIGLYCGSILMQMISLQDRQIYAITTLHGYTIHDGLKVLVDRSGATSAICDMSKFDWDVLDSIEFGKPQICTPTAMWCNKSMEVHSETEKFNRIGFVPVYDCGIAIYERNS